MTLAKLNAALLIAQDKANHYAYGTLAATAGRFLAPLVGLAPAVGALLAAGTLGFVKDVLIDLVLKRGNPSFADFFATFLGGIPLAVA